MCDVYISMENKLLREEDLKHFHTFLLGNEEDAKGLLNVKQQVLARYLLHLVVASGFTWKEEIWVIGHVDSCMQSCTSKRIWLLLASSLGKIVL